MQISLWGLLKYQAQESWITTVKYLRMPKVYFLHYWDCLFIRKDEFHSSLNMNLSVMSYMSSKQQSKYLENLTTRRDKAHISDLRRNYARNNTRRG